MDLYSWIKAFHVMSIIAWMAGLFYLPRLFVYHAAAGAGSEKAETFKIMERRLMAAIMRPAMGASWIFGLWVAYLGGAFTQGWFHAKLALVVLMSAFHEYLGICLKKFAADRNDKSERFYRIINEVPTILMVGIVILVIVRPF